MGHFCPPGSGFRIRIHWPEWIRIRNPEKRTWCAWVSVCRVTCCSSAAKPVPGAGAAAAKRRRTWHLARNSVQKRLNFFCFINTPSEMCSCPVFLHVGWNLGSFLNDLGWFARSRDGVLWCQSTLFLRERSQCLENGMKRRGMDIWWN